MFKIGLFVYTYTYIHCVEFGDSQIFGGGKSGSLDLDSKMVFRKQCVTMVLILMMLWWLANN